MKDLAHHGANDEHVRLASGKQALSEFLSPERLVKRRDGRHVQGLADEGMADFGQAWLAAHAAARLVLARVQSGIGRYLAGIGKALVVQTEGQQHGDGALAYA